MKVDISHSSLRENNLTESDQVTCTCHCLCGVCWGGGRGLFEFGMCLHGP